MTQFLSLALQEAIVIHIFDKYQEALAICLSFASGGLSVSIKGKTLCKLSASLSYGLLGKRKMEGPFRIKED